MKKLVHVAVGVVADARGRILIARRPEHLHQGGLWEFPGGKLDEGEDVVSALRRELHEEVGIDVKQTRTLIKIEHDYGDKRVCLDVHRVIDFTGNAHGKEGQPIKWVSVEELDAFEFPAANRGIINAIRLSDRCMITGSFNSNEECLRKTHAAVQQGVRLVQLRAKHLSDDDYLALARKILVVQEQGVKVLLNTSPDIFLQTNASGLHLNSARLMQMQARPIGLDKLLSVSVHNEDELAQARKLAADMVLVSPVKSTPSHPGATPLGWAKFAALVTQAHCPVYALGRMQLEDIVTAQQFGAQGIAGISGLWP
ncbi:MAG: Nudix family hydrolase [Gammaproteobacteria bacterium]|nr:Nudix family hydrolase [Gammaproteobacteria bacterium]